MFGFKKIKNPKDKSGIRPRPRSEMTGLLKIGAFLLFIAMVGFFLTGCDILDDMGVYRPPIRTYTPAPSTSTPAPTQTARIVVVTATPEPTSTPLPAIWDNLETVCKGGVPGPYQLKFSWGETLTVSLHPGEAKVMGTITSIGSSGFEFCTFTPDGRHPSHNQVSMTWSGGMDTNDTVEVRINAFDEAMPGVYGGWVTLQDLSNNSFSPPFWLEITIAE